MCDITSVSVSFQMTGSQLTVMRVEVREDGTCAVEAMYQQEKEWGFPMSESIDRTGMTYQADLSVLFETIRDICHKSWYHHYLKASALMRAQWYAEVAYVDGSKERWMGTDSAPENIDELYRLMVSYGMPPLRMGVIDSFGHFCSPRRADESLEMLAGYIHVLKRDLSGRSKPSELKDDQRLLLREFKEDVLRYLKTNAPEALGRDALVAWKIKADVGKLSVYRVAKAPRVQMLALLGALARVKDYEAAVLELLQNGTLDRWAERLCEIPRLEQEERDRERRHRQEQLLEAVDENVRQHIEDGGVFTSHDVAKDMGITPQQASTRIRKFVSRGELVPMPGEYPRRYKAA